VGTRRQSSKLILRQYPNCRLQRRGPVGDVSMNLAAFGAFSRDALRVCRDALREGRSIVYTKKIQRKIILDGAATKGQPLHRACAANRFDFVRTAFRGHNI
jgi:hypothetical protein